MAYEWPPDKYRDEDDLELSNHGRGRAPAAARESVRLAATVEKEGRDNGASARVRPAVPLLIWALIFLVLATGWHA